MLSYLQRAASPVLIFLSKWIFPLNVCLSLNNFHFVKIFLIFFRLKFFYGYGSWLHNYFAVCVNWRSLFKNFFGRPPSNVGFFFAREIFFQCLFNARSFLHKSGLFEVIIPEIFLDLNDFVSFLSVRLQCPDVVYHNGGKLRFALLFDFLFLHVSIPIEITVFRTLMTFQII